MKIVSFDLLFDCAADDIFIRGVERNRLSFPFVGICVNVFGLLVSVRLFPLFSISFPSRSVDWARVCVPAKLFHYEFSFSVFFFSFFDFVNNILVRFVCCLYRTLSIG